VSGSGLRPRTPNIPIRHLTCPDTAPICQWVLRAGSGPWQRVSARRHSLVLARRGGLIRGLTLARLGVHLGSRERAPLFRGALLAPAL
jgi:hypothetical protein